MLIPDDWGGTPPKPGLGQYQVIPGQPGTAEPQGDQWWKVLAGLVVGF